MIVEYLNDFLKTSVLYYTYWIKTDTLGKQLLELESFIKKEKKELKNLHTSLKMRENELNNKIHRLMDKTDAFVTHCAEGCGKQGNPVGIRFDYYPNLLLNPEDKPMDKQEEEKIDTSLKLYDWLKDEPIIIGYAKQYQKASAQLKKVEDEIDNHNTRVVCLNSKIQEYSDTVKQHQEAKDLYHKIKSSIMGESFKIGKIICESESQIVPAIKLGGN
ncbi:MAG: hypothetical protein V9H25_06530 [Candidatus Competibacter sp.]